MLTDRERCAYHDPADGSQCSRGGRRLLLSDGLGSLLVRYLCAEHSDFIEAPEAVADHPFGIDDRAALRELGIKPC